MKLNLMSTIGRNWYPFFLFGLAGTVLSFITTSAVFADGDLLEDFFVKVRTLQADFHQVVLDEDLVPLQETSGRMWLSRPGRFRWSYGQPVEQEVLADGVRLWVYDVGLEQVIVRNQSKTLGNTPAALLVNADKPGDSYLIEYLGEQGANSWVTLFPKDSSAPFSQIQLGFENGGLRLVQMLDQLDQITRLQFDNVIVNDQLPNDLFRLNLPEGVDMIKEEL
ncbi:MAG: outer membrane lipoprotein chaperone LolA [Arenicellales bacterium]